MDYVKQLLSFELVKSIMWIPLWCVQSLFTYWLATLKCSLACWVNRFNPRLVLLVSERCGCGWCGCIRHMKYLDKIIPKTCIYTHTHIHTLSCNLKLKEISQDLLQLTVNQSVNTESGSGSLKVNVQGMCLALLMGTSSLSGRNNRQGSSYYWH